MLTNGFRPPKIYIFLVVWLFLVLAQTSVYLLDNKNIFWGFKEKKFSIRNLSPEIYFFLLFKSELLSGFRFL